MTETAISENTVKKEFYQTTERVQVITCWIGIALNMIWFIGDYLSIPEYWLPFLYFRIGVSVTSFFFLVFKHRLKLKTYHCLFILVLGISIQNAYMWSVMDITHMQTHAFAYMVLFIGTGMLVFWETKFSIILLIVTLVSNIIYYTIHSTLTVNQFITNGGLLVLTVLIFCVFLIRNRYILTLKEIRSRLELEKSKALIEFQKEEVEEKNQEIISSLRYAKRLQEALLPPKNLLDSFFKENYFILYMPRDIVCGDFYWAKKIQTTPSNGISKSYLLLAVADCTGHGVPGAFMSLLGSSFLNQSSIEESINTPAEALDYLNQQIIATLNHGYREEDIRDGMDISLIAIDTETKQLAYAGANNPIYIIRNKTLTSLKATKQAIGNMNDQVLNYTNTQFDLQANDCIYLFTDGYADQFGGPKGKKLMKKFFEETLLFSSDRPMDEQKIKIESTFNNWKGNLPQVDDVCVVGIRV